MKAYRIIGLLAFMLPVVLVGTACGRQEEHGTSIHVRDKGEGHGWLGVSIVDVTRSLAKEKDLKVSEGAFVRDVTEDTPADSAGIKGGDIIVEFDGKKVSDASDLSRAVGKTRPGTVVNLTVMRNDEKKSLKATIGKSPYHPQVSIFNVPHPPMVPRLSGGSSAYGLSLMELNQQLGDYFEAPGGKGVLVERVKRNSEGEKAGFKAGDVIVKVGKETIADVDDIWEAMEDYKDGEKVDVEVLRKGVHKPLSLTVEESEHGSGYMFHFNDRPFHDSFKEFDLDLPEKGQMERFQLQGDQLKLEMDKLKEQLKDLPKRINEEMKGLREKIRESIAKVRISRTI